MTQVVTIGLDLAKNVFQAHGADAAGAVVFRRKLRRDQVLTFFAAQAPCLVAMEACPGAHHWGREIGKLGHTVRLIAPTYVKPFVKRQKNDAADAEARRQTWSSSSDHAGRPRPAAGRAVPRPHARRVGRRPKVSSMKKRRAGSRSSWPLEQVSRRKKVAQRALLGRVRDILLP